MRVTLDSDEPLALDLYSTGNLPLSPLSSPYQRRKAIKTPTPHDQINKS